jgi:hypothetical protein
MASLRILSQIPGRLRIQLPAWSGANPRELEDSLGNIDGVRAVQANSLTASVLIYFDPRRASLEQVLSELHLTEAAWCVATATDACRVVRQSKKEVVTRAVVTGTLAHAAVDTLFYTGTAAATALGWTWLAPVAAVHLVADVFAWGFTLRPVVRRLSAAPGPRGAAAPRTS